MQIFINDEQEKIKLDLDMNKLLEKVVIECLELEKLGTNYEVSITFVDNAEIKQLNKLYRNIDKHTDVLSFPTFDGEEFGEDEDLPYAPLLGDVIISLETAKRQSEEFGHTIEREIAYLTAHSMFHLLGYDHLVDDEKSEMREMEKQVMKNLEIFKDEED